MLESFCSSKKRQWIAVLLVAMLNLGLFISEREHLFFPVEQPHIGQERGDESPVLILNAPGMYTNVSPQGFTYNSLAPQAAGVSDAVS